MTTPNNRRKSPTKIPKHAVSAALLLSSPSRRPVSTIAGGVDTEDLIVQFHSLGLRHADAARLLDVALLALDKVLEGLDSHALAAAPVAERISILLPRFNVERLARDCGLARADVQSALALLVLSFVEESRHARH